MSTLAHSPPQPAVIRSLPTEGHTRLGEILRALPAWIISAGVHVLLVFVFVVVVGDIPAKEKARPLEVINTKIVEKEQAFNLTNIDLGINPKVQTAFDVKRIEVVSVPGKVDPHTAMGILGAKADSPVTVPPPPGSKTGQGGAPLKDLLKMTSTNRLLSGGYSGLTVPGGFAGRSGATKQQLLDESGGNFESERAVALALKWLALHQGPKGNWSLDQWNLHARRSLESKWGEFVDPTRGRGAEQDDVAATAFGLLPFLAAGITHRGAANKDDEIYVKTVAAGLKWLQGQQGNDGHFPGRTLYSHALAAIALCEAYGLTSDPNLKIPAQAALNYIIKVQDPEGGGWRYRPRQGGDISVVGWMVMALKSGQMSGLNVPNITLRGAERFLDSVETSDGGRYGYSASNNPTPTRSAVGLLCRQYLGIPRQNPNLRKGVEYVLQKDPPWQPWQGRRNIYCNYYATQVMHHMGGDYWKEWNEGHPEKNQKGMRDTLIATQQKDGSWNPRGDAHGGAGGRVMVTSLSVLTLEVYYRHLPLYQKVSTKK